jgi:O-antigen ligase
MQQLPMSTIQHPSPDRFIRFFSVCLGLFPATLMSVKGAYGLVAVLLLVLSIAGLVRLARAGATDWSRVRALAAPLWIPFAAFFLAFLASVIVTHDAWDGIDYPNRWVLLLPILFFLVAVRDRIEYRHFWTGVAVGAVGNGLVAIYQRFHLHLEQIGGFTAANPFGNVSITLGLLSGVGALYAGTNRRGVFLLIAGWGGIAASLLSTTRGGWPLILPFAVISVIFIVRAPFKTRVALIVLHLAVLAAAYPTAARIVELRTQEIGQDLSIADTQARSESSIGGRLAMWTLSKQIWEEHPIFGVGPMRFKSELHAKNAVQFKSDNIAHQNVAHQEWLDAMARAGILGGLALTAIFLAPLACLARHRALRPCRVQGAAGTIALIGAFVLFGLSNTSFTNHPALLFFIIALSVVWSQYLAQTDVSIPALRRQAGAPAGSVAG